MSPESLETLVDKLTPVRRVRPSEGIALMATAVLLAALAVWLGLGLRRNFAVVFLHPFGLGRSALLLGVGLIAAAELVAMARPRVGRNDRVWKWALALGLLMPALAIAYGAGQPKPMLETMAAHTWMKCLATIAVLAVGIAGFIILWLRRGAPTDLAKAGWLTGLAAGCFGTFAYSLHCPHIAMTAIGIWYSLAVAGCAVIGRAAVPPLIRW